MKYSDAPEEGSVDAAFRLRTNRLMRALLLADPGLEDGHALHLARELSWAGWECPEKADATPGIPSDELTLDTRFLLRLSAPEVDGNLTRADKLASRFSGEGALILGLSIEEDRVVAELLTTVEQAMFALASMAKPAELLERWLRSAGYAGDIQRRIHQLTSALAERYGETASESHPTVLFPARTSDPASWN